MTVTFGPFSVDSQTRQLAEGSQVLHLSPKAFDLLLLLLERRPAVVQKGEIASRIWPGVTVSETSMGGLVKEIRRALRDDPARPAFIRTAHSVGYAFVGTVSSVGSVGGDTAPRGQPDEGTYRAWLAWHDRTFSLAPGENIIGRDPRCTVWVDASGVSRRHARIVVAATEATIEDLGSRNGTAIRRTPVTTPHRLENGDPIRMGATTLTFRQWSEERAARTEALARRGRRRAAAPSAGEP
jgi:DNA-binding winged helix-turn-helix (wHTH) protein